MEYDETKTRPESTRKFLIQQVQEQSSLCDVVVKMGYWEKKFHRCVLTVSPFFDHVLNDNFLEKQTGMIEITIGTPVSLETAIMFLYGQKPKFDHENIENIVQMAEFLLIPNLKSACVDWLKSVTITEENCLKFLQLSSIYDFEIPQCIDYIEENLPEMLQNPQMVTLTKDSVHFLLSDKRLSYVSMDDKLSFLLKWSDVNTDVPDKRNVHIQDLLVHIHFSDVSNPFLKELKQNPDLGGFMKVDHLSLADQSISHSVLIMTGRNNDRSFWCLDLERNRWFRVESESLKEQMPYRLTGISGTCQKILESESAIYFVDKGYEHCSIVMLNISADTCSKINVIESDERFKLKRIDDLKIDEDICIVSVNEYVEAKNRLRKCDQSSTTSQFYMETSTLYIGNIDKGNADIEMTPFLSFKHDEIRQYLIGQNAIAILFKSQKYVAIYDLVDSSLEKIEQSTEYSDNLAQLKDGFVIYNNKRCISLIRINGPYIKRRYSVVEIPFEQTDFEDIKYFLCGQIWYRYYRASDEVKFVFESIPLHKMLSYKSEDPITWKQLPLPKDAEFCSRSTIDPCFEICLPKSKLRCDIECPHCRKTSRELTRGATYENDSDDSMNRDSSDDDDYYVPSYYDGDYDYDYDNDYIFVF